MDKIRTKRKERKKRRDPPAITPNGQYEDRILRPRIEKNKRVATECIRCGSRDIRLMVRPDLFFCLACGHRFLQK